MTDHCRILDEAPPAWHELLHADPGAGPGHRPGLWSALAGAIPGGSVRFLAVESDAVLIGGMGVVIERRAGFEWIHALPWLLGGAPLASEGHHARVDAAFARGLKALMQERRVVGGEWVAWRPAGEPPGAPAIERVPGTTTRVATAIVDLADGIDGVRGRVRRTRRQYLNRDSDSLVFAEDPGALEEVYVLHTRQARHWGGYQPLPLELSRRLLAPPAPLGRLFTIREHGRLLAGTLFLDHPRELFAWWSGVHARARGRHVFPLLLWRAVEWAADRGRARVNLGGSAGRASLVAFKQALGATDQSFDVRWLAANYATPPGRWIAALQRRRRRARVQGDAR